MWYLAIFLSPDSVGSQAVTTPRSCPAFGRHDHATAKSQFGANEFSIFDEALARNGQRGAKVVILMPSQVHVIND